MADMKTPWRVDGVRKLMIFDREDIPVANLDYTATGTIHTYETAKHIVKCVNNYDALKAKYDILAATLEDIKGLTPEEYIAKRAKEGSHTRYRPSLHDVVGYGPDVDPYGYGEAMRKMAAEALKGVDEE